MLVVKDKSMNNIGILESAYNISVKREVNSIWSASFTLTENDPKNVLCSHLNFVEFIGIETGRNYGLYRIMPNQITKDESENSITYECEHVIATLLDDVIADYMQLTNQTTRYVLNALLDMQEVKHWELGRVDFERYFHYKYEEENGLLAPIFDVPTRFNEPYEFTYDTTAYPWKINLIRPSDEVKSEIRWGKDLGEFQQVSDPTEIVNYIIPRGAGEGVNKTNIKSVNGGKDYLKDQDSINAWGVRKYVWRDKRFENPKSLKESAQSLLNQRKNPRISFDIKAVDLSVLPEYQHEQRILNGVTRIIVEDQEYYGRIISEKIEDLSKEHDVEYEIDNKLDDIAEIQTDVERRIQVSEAYSQGSTNIVTIPLQDNADQNTPLVMPFVIDDDVVNVNTLELWLRTKPFRAYSRATAGGGATVQSTSSGGSTTRSTTSGGGTTATSSSGGGTSKSTNSGGGSTQTSTAGGNHRHRVFKYMSDGGSSPSRAYIAANGAGVNVQASTSEDLWTEGSSGNHSHSVSVPSHSHSFTVPNHTHSVDIPSHSHTVSIPSHTHDITLPNHTHDVRHEIVELNSFPSNVTIKVDGNTVDFSGTSADRLNLESYAEKDSNGKIRRGRHEIEIFPNDLARIEADLVIRLFIQSHLGGNY